MKRILIILVTILACTTVFAQTHHYTTNFTYSLKHFVDTIPIEYEKGQVYINVTPEGQKVTTQGQDITSKGQTYRFCLDTGSGQGTIYLNTRLRGMQLLGNVVSRDAAGNKDTVRVVQLPPFSLGKLTITGYVASVFPTQITRNYDAIIGFDIFNKGLCCKIDTEKGYMILTDQRDFFDGEPGYAIHYKLKWWVPYILVSPFKRHWDEVLFDTGSNQLYTMNKRSFDKHAYKSKQVNKQVEARVKGNLSIGNIGAERTDEVAFLNLDRLKWDDFTFLKVNAVTTQGASRIGGGILKYGSVIINGFRHYIRFQPYNGNDSVIVNNKTVTTAYVPKEGLPCVGLILPTSDDYKAGLRQGDIILAIDGKGIRSFTAFQQYPFIKGHTHKLFVRTKEGKNKEVYLKK